MKKVTPKGRPPKQKADRRDHMIRVLANDEELSTLQNAADTAGLSLSTWIRVTVLSAAKKSEAGSPS